MLHAFETMSDGWHVLTETRNDDISVAKVYNTLGTAREMATLFAAAPQLLATIKKLTQAVEVTQGLSGQLGREIVSEAYAVIAKAEGK